MRTPCIKLNIDFIQKNSGKLENFNKIFIGQIIVPSDYNIRKVKNMTEY